MYLRKLLYSTLIVGIVSQNLFALAATRGTPLGGMGTGYVVFDARTGDFATSAKIPPSAFEGDDFKFKQSTSAGFHLYAGGKSINKAKTNIEDAKCPLYTAEFARLNGIKFSLNACGPFIPGDNDLNYQLATSPLACFEMTVKNEGATEMDAAVAMEFTNKSLTRNLLGGADNAVIDTASGNKAIVFPAEGNSDNAYLMVSCDNSTATYTAGAIGTFLTDGILINADGNLVAAKCTIPAGETVRIRFVLSWWRTFLSASDLYGTGKNDEENYYYHNFYKDAKDAAKFGMENFDRILTGVTTYVKRVMGSSFPLTYKERLLNNTYPMIHNAQCTKDGRVAFWEGLFPVIGTIDQAEHAALWYTFNWPKNQWQELSYWLSTAHTGEGEDAMLKGQIHHDFNIAPATWTDDAHFICPWENYLRDDYFWSKNTTTWSDLNTMVIFKAYELMCATGDIDSMKKHFPAISATADRLLLMCSVGNKHLPLKSKSTYDSDKEETPQYASGIALVAFLAMEAMANFVGDTAAAKKYRDWYTDARKEFRSDIYNANFCSGRNYADGDVAGYSWANYFCLEPVMDADVINEGCRRLWQLYSTEPRIQEKLGRWHFYTCDHWGGAEIARGSPDTAMIMFNWDYEFYHKQVPNMAFWQDLWGNHDVYASYVTAPSVWRSYFQMTGYLLDNANKRLWIRPRIPGVMGQSINNAPLINPKCWGTLNYSEVEDSAKKLKQRMFITFDSTVAIRELVLKNNTPDNATPYVLIYAKSEKIDHKAVSTEDWGLEKNIRITFTKPLNIDADGISVEVYTEEVGIGAQNKRPLNHKLAIISAGNGRDITFSLGNEEDVTVDLLRLDGAKIGTLYRKKALPAGKHSFVWNGRTVEGKTIAPAITILRLSTPTGSVSKIVYPCYNRR